ncbi:MAG: hypothetical protein HZB29_02720 [Nitrospinae bacterium]|nr:hypothetical protein [Nitrospinota bacterium]
MRNKAAVLKIVSGRGGVSLIEMLVGMMASIAMIMALVVVISTQSRSYATEMNRIEMITNMELASERVNKAVRMIGYRSGALSGMNASAITAAAADSITYSTDKDSDGTREPYTIRLDNAADPNYDAAHPRLVLADNTAATIQPIGADITSIAFQYYDSAGTLIADTSTQANRDTIRKIKVTITGRTPKTERTGAYMTTATTFQVKPRNFLVD